MADVKREVADSLSEIEKEIVCSVCHCRYMDPKVLPCCHYYCEQCVCKLVSASKSEKSFLCPECRAECAVPSDGIKSLPNAFFINRIKEKVARLEQAYGKVETVCELCCEGKPSCYCNQCSKFLCSTCEESHQRMKALFLSHQVVSLQEIELPEAKQLFDKPVTLKSCAAHEEPLKVFCFDCKCLICRDCTVRDHNGHNCEFNKIAAPKMRKIIAERIEPLQDAKQDISLSLNEVQKCQSELNGQVKLLSDHIKKSFEKLHQILQKREAELVEELNERAMVKNDHLSSQKEKLAVSLAVVENVISYANQCAKLSPDDEIMCMQVEILQQIATEAQKHKQRKDELQPVEEVDLGVIVDFSDALQRLCSAEARVFQLPLTCELCYDSITYNDESEAILTLKYSNGTISKRSFDILCQLKNISSELTTDCLVELGGVGKYRVKFTPTARGQHKLVISSEQCTLEHNEFLVVVTCPPTQFKTPTHVWKNIKSPIGITIDGSDNVIVAEYGGKVLIFNSKGEDINCIHKSQHGFKSLSSVAVNGHVLYLSNFEDSCICEYNTKTKEIQNHKVEQTQGPGHWCICTMKDRIIACEKDQDRRGGLVAYNLQLCKLFHIEGKFGTVCATEDQIFATNQTLIIKIYNKAGDYVKQIKCDGGDGEGFHTGLCITKERMYIGNTSSHSVLVFNRDGVKLASLGKEGDDEGDFNRPRALATDKDEFLYVCDFGNGRIQVF